MSLVERARADLWFVTITILLGVVEVLATLASPLGLAADEAHYWEWSRRLDWGYYSKGPLIAAFIAGSRLLFGDTEFAVRFPAFVCFNLFSLAFYAFVRRQVLPMQALWGWLALRTMLIVAQSGMVMTTDAPAALFWLLAIIGMHRAVVADNRDGWLLFGLASGLGVLAKYTVGILLPSVMVFLAITPAVRHHLRSLAFWIGVGVMGVMLLPLLLWNVDHGWVNLAHNAGHLRKVGDSGGSAPLTLRFTGELIAGQLGMVGPVIFCGMCLAYWRAVRMWRVGDIEAGVFVWSGLPLGLLCLAISLTKRVYANWPLPFDISGALVAVYVFARVFPTERRVRQWVHGGVLVSGLLTALAHLPLFGITFGVPPNLLPTKKLAGWAELGERVEIELAVIRATEGVEPVVIADDYGVASSVAFAAKSHPRAYCALVDHRRMNQYDVWGGWRELKGRHAVLVVKTEARLEELKKHFTRTEPVQAETPFVVRYLGQPLEDYWIARGYGYDGYEFELPPDR